MPSEATGIPVDFFPVGIKEPSPFIKILYSTSEVVPCELPVLVRSTRVRVIDFSKGVECCIEKPVHAAGKVCVLCVQEETFVEESCFLQCARSEKHKATGKKWYAHDLVVMAIDHFVTVVNIFEPVISL